MSKVKDSQTTAILKHLQTGASLTRLEALKNGWGIELPTRIFELKADGYAIETHTLKLPDGKRVASYRLASQPQLLEAVAQ